MYKEGWRSPNAVGHFYSGPADYDRLLTEFISDFGYIPESNDPLQGLWVECGLPGIYVIGQEDAILNALIALCALIPPDTGTIYDKILWILINFDPAENGAMLFENNDIMCFEDDHVMEWRAA